ncbi:MAG: Coenzyme F420 hydrogenase/dehydrogenase, beta subunit C-terminal domain [Clostridia bacterium]|nr:Coenzyme F420 hydrogenase/dehydrogenase, beta subunit C-terminal domain [Clostridia bacterium]
MSDKKVGIITVHRNVNYGANLQAFASCKYINNLGVDAEIIDYYPKELDKDNYLFSWLKLSYDCGKTKSLPHNLKLAVALAVSAPSKNRRLKGFYSFRKNHCKLSQKFENFRDIVNGGYTDVVCGSDQIWNPDVTKGINPYYFGDINGVNNKISYAASMGKAAYNEDDEKKAGELIKNIDYVSVREANSVEYVSNISGKKVMDVCDPVFLLPKEEYEKVAKPIKVKKPYLLVYSVIKNPEMLESAREYAEENNLTLVEICQDKSRHAKHIQLSTASPEEFLGAVNDARAVVTNSFHGTAFSLIFKKELYVFENKKRKGRISNLLAKAGLEERIVEDVQKLPTIDYNKVAKKLDDYINTSKEFLKTAVLSSKKPLTDNCVGCGACKAVCKADAISITKDYGGFIKSYIDTGKCVNCNICFRTCPAINIPEKSTPQRILAFKAEDEIRKNSTSGGAASAIADAIINDGGAIYGASLDSEFRLKHIRVEKKEDLSLLQGTKYIQSDMTDCFDSIKNDLKNNKSVLFIGTPCQVAGVRKFITQQKIDEQKLYLCDIICHGVPSPKVFSDYIEWLEKTENEKIKKYFFRNKAFSWRGDSSAVETASGLKRSRNVTGFMNLYYSSNITNDACFNCNFTSTDRVSDITVSDFWGIEKEKPEFEDGLGVSMVMLNTEKGKSLFDAIKGESVEATLDNAKQPQLYEPVKKPEGYCDFRQNYKKDGIEYAMKTYGVPKQNLKTKIYNLINGIR